MPRFRLLLLLGPYRQLILLFYYPFLINILIDKKIPYIFFLLFLMIYVFFRIKKNNKRKIEQKERINNIPNFLKVLDAKIKEFKPAQNYKEEKLYQAELVGFLKNNYPSSKVEETRDYSRPDIIIDDIAIEIKGPTDMSALKTLPDKINSYIPKWDFLFIVLFNINITEDPKLNDEIYKRKKKEIIDNTIDSKKQKIFFIEI